MNLHPANHLTDNERKVVTLLMTGCSNSEIAAELQTGVQQIKNKLTKVYDKCGVNTRLELALFVFRNPAVLDPGLSPAGTSSSPALTGRLPKASAAAAGAESGAETGSGRSGTRRNSGMALTPTRAEIVDSRPS
jgi:DNA-binding CsgD family transcriptional regulator